VICDTFDENWIHRHMDIDGLPYGVEH
jgi:hypothetical protein